MASGPEQPWPFLAILTASDGERVRGLGFVDGDVVVTLPHIAERADVVLLPSTGGRHPVRPLAVEGAVALMALSEQPPPNPVHASWGLPGGQVSIAIVSDYTPRVRIVPGSAGKPDAEGRFTVPINATLGEDETAAGSPVVADGAVVGIVGPTATSGSVDAFGTDAIVRLLNAGAASLHGQLSSATQRALGNALEIAAGAGPAGAVVLGVLRSGADDARATVPAQMLRRIDSDRLDLAYARFSVPFTRETVPTDPAALTDEELRRSAIGGLLARAEAVQSRVADDRLHRRHLLAAALLEPHSAFAERFFETLDRSQYELRRALHEVIARTYEPHDLWDAVFEAAADFDLAGGHLADLVDATKGIPLEKDHLGLGVDVTMLAALIADTNTPMPLSIGLFGEWGSGKSYFMALLRAEIKRLATSGDPPYRSEIVQIGFNAWHYADSNLWASLGDEIFEQLAGPQAQTADALREALREDLDDRLQRRVELKAATERAQAETKRLAAEVDKAAGERRTSARALAKAVLGAPAVREEVQPALDKLGVKDAAEQVEVLSEELERAPEDVATVRRAVPPAWIAVGVVVALAAGTVVALAASHAFAGVGAAAATALTVTGLIVGRIRSGARALHQVAEGLRRDQDAAVAPELRRLRDAETTERMLQTQLDEVIRQVGELSRELAELTPGQRLYRFVAERAASETYRGQLGLISTIRKDFEQLNDLMKEWRKDRADGARRPIDRIVLYIDDLDRCSPQQVVEVLQAVHLLLALDLFVVVVGVDPRWLLHSLRREYRSLLTTNANGDRRWESTPQDYLEKIFNIPFALPRMTPTSFGQLVGSFSETDADDAEAHPDAPLDEPSAEPQKATATEVADAEVAQAEDRSEVARIHAGARETERRPLTRGEIDMLTALAPLVETPRETKRLVNLYRMMRSTRDLSPAARFLGEDDTPGEYQAVVILLGLLSGHARLLNDVLLAAATNQTKGGLRGRAPGETWAGFAQGLTPHPTDTGFRNDIVGDIPPDDVEEWTRLADGLEAATERVALPDLSAFQTWAPRIARFSFLLSRYADSDESRARAAPEGA